MPWDDPATTQRGRQGLRTLGRNHKVPALIGHMISHIVRIGSFAGRSRSKCSLSRKQTLRVPRRSTRLPTTPCERVAVGRPVTADAATLRRLDRRSRGARVGPVGRVEPQHNATGSSSARRVKHFAEDHLRRAGDENGASPGDAGTLWCGELVDRVWRGSSGVPDCCCAQCTPFAWVFGARPGGAAGDSAQ
jgi:hypothetical protein